MNIKNPLLDEIERAYKADVIHSYRTFGKIVTIRFNQKTKKDTILKVHTHLEGKYKKHIQTVEYVGTHALRIYLYEK
jgi:formamidopyrimidine-DNA glycosylase